MIQIGGRTISIEHPPYYIADIAANHNGDINRAYQLIELAKESGAHAAKFQNFTAEKIVSEYGFGREVGQISHQAGWKKTVFETYRDASLPAEWTPLLKTKCDEVGIEYMTSPYDLENVDLADRYLNAFKIGSGDITWPEILRHIASKGKPVLLATGAATLEEVKQAAALFGPHKLVLMQCNTNYTSSADNYDCINLRVLNTYAREFPGVVLGLSDHMHSPASVAGAIALGARVIERHFTDNLDLDGPDHRFSMTPDSFAEMVDICDTVYRCLGDGVKRIEPNEEQTAVVQRRGLYYTRDIFAGEILRPGDLKALRPALPDGFLPYREDALCGKALLRGVEAEAPARQGDFS